MNFEKKDFEQKRLIIDKDRALVYSQLSCPLDCKYCFVEDLNFNQKKNVSYISEEQFELIEKLPEEISIIMLGCDTEFFQSRKNSLEILERLSKLNKDISVITKLSLSKDFIEKIKEIDKKLNYHNNFLSFSISLSSLDTAEKWEPKAPSPGKRIETLKIAYESNLKTLVALRPLLPSVSGEEIERIVAMTEKYCYGYYSGSLYLKKLELPGNEDITGLKTEKLQPHWMPEGNIFYKIEKEGQMDLLRQVLAKYKKPLFSGAAEGMEYLKRL